MKKDNIRTIKFRRERKGLTDYRKRLKLLSSRKARFVVRKSLKSIQASIVNYEEKGDIVKVSSHSNSLRKFGWPYSTKNLPAAYLVGFLLGKKAKRSNMDEAILDIGLQKSVKGSKIYAVLAGALDAGLKVPHNKEILPNKERISGMHISFYAQKLKKEPSSLKKQFGDCLKNNSDPETITKKFEEVKTNIEKNLNK